MARFYLSYSEWLIIASLLPRFQTQSGPPQDDGGDGDGGSEVGGQLIVASGDAAPVLEPTEHALDEIAPLVDVGIEGMEALAGRVVGDHRLGTALAQELAQPIAVVGCVGDAQSSGRHGRQQRPGDAHIAELARGYFEGDEPAETVDDGVDLRRPPAARATDRLRQGPPFPPPAERWALAVVLSMICVSAASVVTRASNRRCQSPRRDHRLNRL